MKSTDETGLTITQPGQFIVVAVTGTLTGIVCTLSLNYGTGAWKAVPASALVLLTFWTASLRHRGDAPRSGALMAMGSMAITKTIMLALLLSSPLVLCMFLLVDAPLYYYGFRSANRKYWYLTVLLIGAMGLMSVIEMMCWAVNLHNY